MEGADWLGYDVSPDRLWVTKVWCQIWRDHAKSAKSVLNAGQSQCCKDMDAYIIGTNTVKMNNIFEYGGSAINTKAVTAKCAKESPATYEIVKTGHSQYSQNLCKQKRNIEAKLGIDT